MNKTLKYIVLLAIACFVGKASAQELKSEVFSILNLDYPGLEKVKALHQEGKDEDAAKALLDYYRARTNVKTPDINLNKVTTAKKTAVGDDGLKHTFFVHKGYQPSYNYGEDINWQYWPGEKTMNSVGNCTATNGSLRWERLIAYPVTRNMLKSGHISISTGLKRIRW